MSTASENRTDKELVSNQDTIEDKKKMCGIIMPIADTDGYSLGHWKDVLAIITEAISDTDFDSRLVSDDIAVGLIQERIVTNIYNDDIVVCDVSSKNPNVMFELGLRLAFDKPTIIIKDERTGYSFDTNSIEHLNYPSSLRFADIKKFKKDLISKIEGTYKKSVDDSAYSPFLKHFGKTIIPATIGNSEVPVNEYIIEELKSLSRNVSLLRRNESFDLSNRKNNNLFIDENDLSHEGQLSFNDKIEILKFIKTFPMEGKGMKTRDLFNAIMESTNSKYDEGALRRFLLQELLGKR